MIRSTAVLASALLMTGALALAPSPAQGLPTITKMYLGTAEAHSGALDTQDMFRVGYACTILPETVDLQVPWVIHNVAGNHATTVALEVRQAPAGSTWSQPGPVIASSTTASVTGSATGTLAVPITPGPGLERVFAVTTISDTASGTLTTDESVALIHFTCTLPATPELDDVLERVAIEPHDLVICDTVKWVGLRDPSTLLRSEAPVAGQYRRNHLETGEPCAVLNGSSGHCEENGDCNCGSQPPLNPVNDPFGYVEAFVDDPVGTASQTVDPQPDTDQDGVYDDDDVDDDCDHLGDSLEEAVALPTTIPSDPFDLSPRKGGIQFKVGLRSFSQGACVDQSAECEPYMTVGYLGYGGPGAHDQAFEFLEFSLADHVEDHEQTGGSYTFPTGPDGWATGAQFTSAPVADNFATWGNKAPAPSGHAAVTGLPQIKFEFKLMEHDGHAGDSDGDDVLQDQFEVVQLASNMATGATGALVPKPWGTSSFNPVPGSTLEAIGLEIAVSADICMGSSLWGQLVAMGTYAVQSDALPAATLVDC